MVSGTLCAECVNYFGYVSCSVFIMGFFQSFLWIHSFTQSSSLSHTQTLFFPLKSKSDPKNCCLNYPEDIHLLVLQASKGFLLKHVHEHETFSTVFAYLSQFIVLAVLHRRFVLLQYELGIIDHSLLLSVFLGRASSDTPALFCISGVVLSCQLNGKGSS